MFTKKSISLQKLANGKYVFEIQPTIIIWIITVATSITQTRMTQIRRYSCKPELNFQWFSCPNLTEIYPDTLNSSLTRTVFCFPSEFELPVVIISSLRQWLLTILWRRQLWSPFLSISVVISLQTLLIIIQD